MYEVKSTISRGRCLIANESIPIGYELLVESPFACVLFPSASSSSSSSHSQLTFHERQVLQEMMALEDPFTMVLCSRVFNKCNTVSNKESFDTLCSSSSQPLLSPQQRIAFKALVHKDDVVYDDER